MSSQFSVLSPQSRAGRARRSSLITHHSSLLAQHSSLLTAFTLVEVLIVMLVLGIVFGLGMPLLGDSRMLSLREAARMVAADLEYAQSESIVHGDDPRLVKFDTSSNSYWVAAASAPDTPLTDPSNRQPYLITFGTGRASSLTGVVVQALSLGGDDTIQFNAFGSPDQTTDATIRLAIQAAGGTQVLTVTVQASTGAVTVN